jgi:hypothetical protein
MVNAKLSQAKVVKQKIDELSINIDAAWWEGFDIGKRGISRAMLKIHADLMYQLYERFYAMQTSFHYKGQSHLQVMSKVSKEMNALATSVGSLLNFATVVASDAEVTKHEANELENCIEKVKSDLTAMTQAFDGARRSYAVIDEDIFALNAFVFTLTAYARLVLAYAEKLENFDVTVVSLPASMWNAVRETWSYDALFADGYHRMYTIRYSVSIIAAFLVTAALGYDGSIVGPATLLISTRVSADVRATLNMLLGVTVGTMAAATIYGYTCMLGAEISHVVLPTIAFLFWLATLFVYYHSGDLAFLGMYAAAFASKSFVQVCPEHGGVAADMGVEKKVSGIIIAVLFTAVCEELISLDRPSRLAAKTFNEMMQLLNEGLEAMWQGKDCRPIYKKIPGSLALASNLNGAGKNEPRFSRNAYKGQMYDQLLSLLYDLQRDLETLSHAAEGSDPNTITDVFKEANKHAAFEAVRADMRETLIHLTDLSDQLLTHDGGIPASMDQLQVKTGLDQLEDIPALIKAINASGMKFPDTLKDSCEDDVIVQLSVVLFMCKTAVKTLAEMIRVLTMNA